MPMPLSSKNRWEQMSDPEKLDFLVFRVPPVSRILKRSKITIDDCARLHLCR